MRLDTLSKLKSTTNQIRSLFHTPSEGLHLQSVALFMLTSRQVVAATAGIAIGPLFAVPLARRYGHTCIFFWSMIGLLVTGVWSATMTHANQYGAFVTARLFGGLFGGTAPALGADTIIDMFFLHQRGKAFTAFNLSFLAGVVVGPTLSGFIVGSTSWTVQFWWSNGLEALIVILTLALLEDTYYDRTSKEEGHRQRSPDGFFANRMAVFFCGPRMMRPITMNETVSPSSTFSPVYVSNDLLP